MEGLQKALNDSNWHMRETAIFALSALDRPPIKSLAAALHDEDASVREATAMMLQKIQTSEQLIQPLASPVPAKNSALV